MEENSTHIQQSLTVCVQGIYIEKRAATLNAYKKASHASRVVGVGGKKDAYECVCVSVSVCLSVCVCVTCLSAVLSRNDKTIRRDLG